MLQNLFHNNSEGNTTKKKRKTRKKKGRFTSRYHGVSKGKNGSFIAQCSAYYLGLYEVESDAALAYDSLVRVRGVEDQFEKINFDTQEDYLHAREKELENGDINNGDLEEALGQVSSFVSKVVEEASEELDVLVAKEVEADEVTSLLSGLFHGNGDESQKKTSKKKKKVTSNTPYHGVCMKRFKQEEVFESNFCIYRLGVYSLAADAALVYDSAIRARGLERHYEKINFDTKEDYLQAREKEMKEQSFEVDLEQVLSFIADVMVAKGFKA